MRTSEEIKTRWPMTRLSDPKPRSLDGFQMATDVQVFAIVAQQSAAALSLAEDRTRRPGTPVLGHEDAGMGSGGEEHRSDQKFLHVGSVD